MMAAPDLRLWLNPPQRRFQIVWEDRDGPELWSRMGPWVGIAGDMVLMIECHETHSVSTMYGNISETTASSIRSGDLAVRVTGRVIIAEVLENDEGKRYMRRVLGMSLMADRR